MRPGALVRFVAPLTDAEASERFHVVEVRGDRVLVTPTVSTLAIAPTFVYLASDLCLAHPLPHPMPISPCPLVVAAIRADRRQS